MSDLVLAKETWLQAAGNRDYSFDLMKECYCSDNGRTIRVEVENSRSLSPRAYPGATEMVSELDLGSPTIPELFQLVLDLTKLELESKGDLEVTYDSELGFPRTIVWDARQIDGSFTISLGNVEIG